MTSGTIPTRDNLRVPSHLPAPTPGPGGDWPRTSRGLPWLLAGFLTMLCIVPFDSITFPITLPVDSKFDRVMLVALIIFWVGALLTRRLGGPRFRGSPMTLAIVAWLFLITLSVLANISHLALYEELNISVKKIAIVVGYVAIFFIVSSCLRPAEVKPFCVLFIVLATIAALGTIYEYRTGFNVFLNWTRDLSFGTLTVTPPSDKVDGIGRASVNGPTSHGLAIATILAMALPFATLGLTAAKNRRAQILYALAVCILVAGGIATVRKTSAVLPMIVAFSLFAYRPRQILRLIPLGLIIFALVHVLAPGALGSVGQQIRPDKIFQLQSTQGRTADYSAVEAEIVAHPVIGRGYGSFDSLKYRFLDNEYLGSLVEIGIVGLAILLWVFLGGVLAAHRAQRRARDPDRRNAAIAVVAAALAFTFAGLLFDILSFPQTPYLFFFLIGLAVVAGDNGSGGKLIRTRPAWVRTPDGNLVARPAMVESPHAGELPTVVR